MTRPSPFRYFKTSPEVIRLAVMLYLRYTRSLRNVEDLTCHRSFTQPRPEPVGHLRLSVRVEQSPGARNFHRMQRDGRLRLSGAGRSLRGSGSRGPGAAFPCCSW
jgi:hypothetical protein